MMQRKRKAGESMLLTAVKEAESKERVIDIPLVDNTSTREELIQRIESITLKVIEQITAGKLPSVSYLAPNKNPVEKKFVEEINEEEKADDIKEGCCAGQCCSLKSILFNRTQDSYGYENEEEKSQENLIGKNISFGQKKSRNKFALMMKAMATSHRLLITNSTITRRSFYYNMKNEMSSLLVPSQRYVDEAVNKLAELLNCAPWDLGLIATSKGLVAGNLTLSLADGRIIDCIASPEGTLIPQIVSNVISIRAKAKFVLVVEKDAIFQKLLQENCVRFLDCIVITGKGYPDAATRMLVKLLSEKLELPVYAIVDADPFGLDIMCVYRFGSMALSRENDSLACPRVRWLGVHPSELAALGIRAIPLTSIDISKLASIEKRAHMSESLLREIKVMHKGKAEIEAISSISRNFLTVTYLSWKIKGKDYI